MGPSARKVVLANILVLSAFFVLCEGGARLWYLQHGIPFWATSTENVSTLYDRTHPYLPVVLAKNTHLSRSAEIQTNSLGFRGPEVEQPKPSGRIRIVALGGSTTFGVAADEATTWPELLRAELESRLPQTNLDVVNAAVPGYNSMESLLNLVTRVLPLEPDYVIVYHAYNDMKAYVRARSFEPDYSDWRNRDNPHDTLHYRLRHQSRFYFGLSNLLAKRSKRASKSNARPPADLSHEEPITSFHRNLFNIATLARAHGATPVLATFNLALDADMATRSTLGLDDAQTRELGARYNKAIRELAAELNVPLVDVEAAVPDTKEAHIDLCHFTEAGRRLVARAFADRIEALIREKTATAGVGTATTAED